MNGGVSDENIKESWRCVRASEAGLGAGCQEDGGQSRRVANEVKDIEELARRQEMREIEGQHHREDLEMEGRETEVEMEHGVRHLEHGRPEIESERERLEQTERPEHMERVERMEHPETEIERETEVEHKGGN